VPGSQVRELLIRVVGPSLAPFGVAGAWADPDFQLCQGTTPVSRDSSSVSNQHHYNDWSQLDGHSADTATAFNNIFNYVGAFPLLSDSKDSADVVRLSPGAYTVVAATGAGDPGGEALIEVYALP